MIYSKLRLGNIVLEDTSAIGIREQRSWEHGGQVIRDVNGTLMTGSAMRSPWSKKARYTWSASGPGVLDLPGFDHLEHLDTMTINPIDPWSFSIPAGVTEFVLPRTPVAGSVKLRHPLLHGATEELHDFEIAGKTISLFGTTALKGTFVPDLLIAMVDWEKEVDEDAARYSWRLEVTEV